MSRTDPPRESYETVPIPESGSQVGAAFVGGAAVSRSDGGPGEVWLRGNLRPVVWLAAVTAGLAAVFLAALAVGGAPQGARLAAAIGCGAVGAGVGGLAVAAARPRLELHRDRLRVRLAPGVVREVPLACVECFFPGSQVVAGRAAAAADPPAAWRINTLVMRLAERATEHAARPTFTPWGTWQDGYVIFDGRWCEPLSPDLARQLGRRLVDAKRASAAVQGVAGGTP